VGKEWNDRVETYSRKHPEVKSIWFDFHKECSSKNGGWAKLRVLLQSSKEFLDTHKS